MPFLQGSGQISIANLNGFFPGSGTSMSNFYRGNRTPATKSITVREPASGDTYVGSVTFWQVVSGHRLFLRWGGTWIVWDSPNNTNTTSITVGGFTYFRGSYVNFDGKNNTYEYRVWRTSVSSQAINTGIPSSGQISLSQFYGAETP